MFALPLEFLREEYPHIKFSIGLCRGLDEEKLFPGAVLIDGDWREKCVGWDYDIVFVVNFNCEDIHDTTLTKAEKCCIEELGIPPISGYPALSPKGIVGVSFFCTSVPDLTNPDEATAKLIWDDIIGARYIPVEVFQKHVFWNPVGIQFPFVDKTIRDWPAKLDTLIAMISKCDFFVSAVGGPFHLACSILGEHRVLLLEKDIPAGCFTHTKIATADLKNYKHEVLAWLKE